MNADTLRRYGFRLLAVALCLAAFFDLRPLSGAGDQLAVVVIDVSASIGVTPAHLPEGLRVDPRWVLVADGFQEVVGGAAGSRLERGASRLGSALRHVAETWPGRDVVLVTDGRDTEGDAIPAARSVRARGGRVFTAPPAHPAADVALLSARLVAGGPLPRVRVELTSSTSGAAELRLAREGQVVGRKTLILRPGETLVAELEDPAVPPGGCTYQVQLVPGPGVPNEDPGNDRLRVGLRPERRVVVVWGAANAGDLGGEGFVVRSALDIDLGQLEAADCVVCVNLPWADLGTAASAELERFVVAGGRLLLVGGPDAFAGGGWAGTPLETRLSPLRVPRRPGTGLALVLALDCSASVEGATLAHLREAVRRALQGIAPGEQMGVLTFTDVPDDSLLSPGVIASGQPEALKEVLAGLDALVAGGPTDLIAAIKDAARRVHAIEARERRIILLTDGDPDHPPDEASLRAASRFLQERGIQFGALVLGDAEAAVRLRRTLTHDPDDVKLLEDASQLPLYLLHRLGQLRSVAASLPRPDRLRVMEETGLALTLEDFRPRALQQLETAVDAGARTLIQADYAKLSPSTYPFAAVRPVGAGLVVAVAWGPLFEARADRPTALTRFGPWVRALASAADRGLSAELDGETLSVRYPAAAGRGGLMAWSRKQRSTLVEVGPGVFRGALPAGASSGVRVGVVGHAELERPLRLPARPPAEHRGAGLDGLRMQQIAEAGGGRRLALGEAPPERERPPGLPLAPWLLLAACILLVLDRLWSKPLGLRADV